jgi:hypothetical protein
MSTYELQNAIVRNFITKYCRNEGIFKSSVTTGTTVENESISRSLQAFVSLSRI